MQEPGVAEEGAIGKFVPNFLDRVEEMRFRAARAAVELRDLRAVMVLFIAVNSFFAPLDAWLFGEDLTRILLLRLALANAALGAILALTFIPWLARRIAVVTFASVLFYVVFYALFNAVADAPPIFISGIALVFFGTYAVAPVRYTQAVILAWPASAIYLGLVTGLGLLSMQQFTILAGELAAVNSIGMFTLYRLERLRRREFRNLNQIAAERSRYHDLLVRILPASIAERMRGGEQHIADHFEEASVLFTDIAGFTRLSAKLKPAEVVTFLERVFAAVDRLVEKHGLEKIKTVGDAYLIAAGLPQPRPDHAEAIADFALDLQREAPQIGVPGGGNLEIRIGFHCGPLIAGVIGESRFLYDMWGDTVNVASRMESLGEAGKIQVSDEARQKLRHSHVLEPRGIVSVKGRGDMQTWWLTGRA
ncbi:MAG: adenylate/guanylate cyclase domain-containing protein [Alphaproteobacteria bacterium]|nr:adenylate/guanylate cyclase domain-containing protein [Alphaproteobacteria bacterium]